jgi:hypothetical protein
VADVAPDRRSAPPATQPRLVADERRLDPAARPHPRGDAEANPTAAPSASPDDKGGRGEAEPGDDKGGATAEPGDDKGGSTPEPGDDNGGHKGGGDGGGRHGGSHG